MAGNPNIDQRRVKGNLTGSGGQKVFPAQHVGDAHQGIIDGVHKGIQRLSASPDKNEVRGGGGGKENLAAHQIIEAAVQLGHPQAQRGDPSLVAKGLAFCIREIPFVIVVSLLRVTAQRLVAGNHFLVGDKTFIQVARLQQRGDDVLV